MFVHFCYICIDRIIFWTRRSYLVFT